MSRLIITVSLIFSVSSQLACGAPPLNDDVACPSGEVTYFSCRTARSKLISLCAAEEKGSASTLTYYFGNIDSPELSLAASLENKYEPFRFNHYFRYGVDYFRVSFVREGYRYEIYKDYDMEAAPVERSGIIVSSVNGAGGEVDIKCRGMVSGDLSPLSSMLKCDKDNALGCGNAVGMFLNEVD